MALAFAAPISGGASAEASRLRTFRPDIQGLRAVAIILVVFGHAGAPLLGGVDLSFVISGFIMTSQLDREQERSGKISFGKFYARRARRLLPMATLVTLVTVLATWLIMPLKLRTVAWDAICTALSVINYRLAGQGTDYVHLHTNASPLQHAWSLSVEEQFYLLWPLLLLGALALGIKLGRRRLVAGILLAVVVVGSLGLSIVLTKLNQPLAYFGFQTRAWELGIGALVAICAKRLSQLPLWVAAAMSWVGLMFLLVTVVLVHRTTELPGYAVGGPVLGGALVIIGGCANPKYGVEWVLGRALPNFIGQLSYSWYLWHWPFFVLTPVALGMDLGLSGKVKLIVLTFVLSICTYFWIEKPFREHPNLKSLVAKPWRGLVMGVTFIATTVAACTAVLTLTVPSGTKLTTPVSYVNPVLLASLVEQG
ncbi:MAG TPA: acyltransferase, partial [Candidatus Saccharimonadales bacterium]|nr:acyltransferase [Candidatus Saccharimonadales bacterium]